MKWFKHDSDMHRNRKIKKLIRTHGATGYAFWCLLLEKLYESEGSLFQIEADELWFEDVAEDLKLGDYRTPIRILDTLAALGMISTQLWGDHIIYADAIAQRGDQYTAKKAQAAEKKRRYRAKKRAEKVDCPPGTNGHVHHVPPSDIDLESDRSFASASDLQIQNSDPDSASNLYPEQDPNQEKTHILTRSSFVYGQKSEENGVKTSFQNTQGASESLERGMESVNPEISEGIQNSPLVNSGEMQSGKVQKLSVTRKRATVPRRDLQKFIECFNQHRPQNWSAVTTLTPRRERTLKAFVRLHGTESAEVFQDALAYARGDKWATSHDLTFENFMTNDKPTAWAEKFRSGCMNSRDRTHQQNQNEVRSALEGIENMPNIYEMIKNGEI